MLLSSLIKEINIKREQNVSAPQNAQTGSPKTDTDSETKAFSFIPAQVKSRGGGAGGETQQ